MAGDDARAMRTAEERQSEWRSFVDGPTDNDGVEQLVPRMADHHEQRRYELKWPRLSWDAAWQRGDGEVLREQATAAWRVLDRSILYESANSTKFDDEMEVKVLKEEVNVKRSLSDGNILSEADTPMSTMSIE
ncbi:hypothetical protein Scep_014520 [Stephania cephalantha]|uniref:Uncharacterized protein n=1 Tax=Stephania cephalantha TaxID=152367 RepID=A0AAP0J1E5_9MAGN